MGRQNRRTSAMKTPHFWVSHDGIPVILAKPTCDMEPQPTAEKQWLAADYYQLQRMGIPMNEGDEIFRKAEAVGIYSTAEDYGLRRYFFVFVASLDDVHDAVEKIATFMLEVIRGEVKKILEKRICDVDDGFLDKLTYEKAVGMLKSLRASSEAE